jgi:hypothetical protein
MGKLPHMRRNDRKKNWKTLAKVFRTEKSTEKDQLLSILASKKVSLMQVKVIFFYKSGSERPKKAVEDAAEAS